MAKEKEIVTIEELAYSTMIQTEALNRLLAKKGIINKEELLEEVRTVSLEQKAKQGGPAGES